MLNKLKQLFIAQLTEGVSPHSLALSCALVFVLATFPVAGLATVTLFVLAVQLGLNQPIIQSLNYALTPIYILLLPVYLRLGEWTLGATAVSINPQVITAQIFANWRMALAQYGTAGIHAILGWALVAPLAGVAIYITLRPLCEGFSKINVDTESN